MDKPNQRKGSTSNTEVGRDFEAQVRLFLAEQGLELESGFEINIGISSKKPHKFDFGDQKNRVIVECKSHTWTEGDNVPSAKMTTWDQAMLYFYVIRPPDNYRKIFFILRDYSESRKETLGQYYIRTKSHLIPPDVEIWEYDEQNKTAMKIK